MKKYLIILLLLTGTIFQTQLFSYSGELIGDTKCSEINESTRYSNLSPTIITKIDAIGDRINEKYKLKDNIYKEKVYNLFEKVLNEHLQKTTYSGVQKEVLLRIGDYFVCKKENLNITQEFLEIHNLQISNITDHGIKVTWEGNPNAQTWLYVKKTGSTGLKHNADNNVYEYLQLGSGYEFTLFIQGLGSDVIKEVDFKTLSKDIVPEETIDRENTTTNTEEIRVIINTSENKYLEEVNLPKCDANNSEVQFIKTNDDWKHINDENKRIFCVNPGDYRSLGSINITTSGTKDKRRYIVLNNGNDLHPGKLPRDTNNIFYASFATTNNASYWTVDRAALVSKNTGYTTGAFKIRGGSQYWIINRFYSYDINNSININDGAHNNTIQNSRFEDMRESDAVTVELSSWHKDDVKIYNTKIINNEFYNQNDGFQSVRSLSGDYPDLRQAIRGDGTIVDSNHFYIDDKTKPTTENAIDLKFGSDSADNPMIISNNIMWGYTGEGNRGDAAISGHYNVHNLIFENNIFFDNAWAWSSGSGGPPNVVDQKEGRTGLVHSTIRGNLFYKNGSESKNKYPFKNAAIDTQVVNNIFIDNENGFAEFSGNFGGSTFENNDICNTPNSWNKLSGNDTFFINSIKNNNHYSSSIEAGYTKDFIFTADKFTNNPRVITLKNVLKAD